MVFLTRKLVPILLLLFACIFKHCLLMFFQIACVFFLIGGMGLWVPGCLH